VSTSTISASVSSGSAIETSTSNVSRSCPNRFSYSTIGRGLRVVYRVGQRVISHEGGLVVGEGDAESAIRGHRGESGGTENQSRGCQKR